MRGESPDDVSGAAVGPIFTSHESDRKRPVKMGTTAAPETSSGNSPRTPCKIPKTKNQYSFHGGSPKSRSSEIYLRQNLIFEPNPGSKLLLQKLILPQLLASLKSHRCGSNSEGGEAAEAGSNLSNCVDYDII